MDRRGAPNTDADFLRVLRDRVRDHAVHADRIEPEADDGEDAEQVEDNSALRHRALHRRLERPQVNDRNGGVEVGATDRSSSAFGSTDVRINRPIG